jgi:hypothetical protein
MTYWPRVNLSAAAGTYFVAGSLRAAVNMYGLIELFVSDYYGNIWHAAQSHVPGLSPGPLGRPIIRTIWGSWTQFGTPVPSNGGTFPISTSFTVATNGDGRLEVIAVGPDRNPYHMYQLPPPPNTASLSETLNWSGWVAMTQPPAGSLGGLFIENWWPVAATLGGRIVVCYLSALQATPVIYYDYQVPDATQVGGVGWASVANNGLFTIAVPAPADQGFFSISLVPSAGGLSLLALSLLWGIGATGYYAASLTTPSGAWSPWQGVPPASNNLPRVYPGAALSGGVSAAVEYIPGGGAALFFSDNSGALNVLRQGLTQANPGAPVNQVAWNATYDAQLPANSICPYLFNVAVSEDPVADASDATNLHQMALFGSANGLSLLALNFQAPAQVPAPPAPPATVGFWPTYYNASSSSPTILDQSSAGEFTSLDQVVSVVQNAAIQAFAVTDSTPNVYGWTEPA